MATPWFITAQMPAKRIRANSTSIEQHIFYMLNYSGKGGLRSALFRYFMRLFDIV